MAKTPNTAPAATAAAPRASLVAFVVTSALASSISSRTRRVTRSETSLRATAMFSLLSGKALEDQGGDEAAGERSADRDLRAVG